MVIETNERTQKFFDSLPFAPDTNQGTVAKNMLRARLDMQRSYIKGYRDAIEALQKFGVYGYRMQNFFADRLTEEFDEVLRDMDLKEGSKNE